MKAAVAQLAPGNDLAQNVEQTVHVLREAQRQGARLVVLPELCASPYQLDSAPLESWAEEIPQGRTLQRWLAEAKRLRIYCVAGLLERAGDRYFNTAVVLGPQGLLGCYRKAHLFGWERARLTAGNHAYWAVETSQARLGVLVCYDLRFVEAVRLSALGGLQVLCVPAAWSDAGKPQPWDRYGFSGAAHLALGHAYANRLFVLCANRVGKEGKVRYLGNSLIAGPSGHPLAGPASATEPALLVQEINPGLADNKRVGAHNDILADRRTDLYSLEAREPDISESSRPRRQERHRERGRN